jgi:hypothetical protein
LDNALQAHGSGHANPFEAGRAQLEDQMGELREMGFQEVAAKDALRRAWQNGHREFHAHLGAAVQILIREEHS